MKTAWETLRDESIAAMGLSKGKDEALQAAYNKYKESLNENVSDVKPSNDD